MLEIVSKSGKYDFAICRHTLEDIENPQFVTKKLQQVAKADSLLFQANLWKWKKDFIENFQKLEACIIIDGVHDQNGRLYGLPKMGWTDLISDRNLKK